MAIDKSELEELMKKADIGSRTRKKLLRTLEHPEGEATESKSKRTRGHGAPHADTTPASRL